MISTHNGQNLRVSDPHPFANPPPHSSLRSPNRPLTETLAHSPALPPAQPPTRSTTHPLNHLPLASPHTCTRARSCHQHSRCPPMLPVQFTALFYAACSVWPFHIMCLRRRACRRLLRTTRWHSAWPVHVFRRTSCPALLFVYSASIRVCCAPNTHSAAGHEQPTAWRVGCALASL